MIVNRVLARRLHCNADASPPSVTQWGQTLFAWQMKWRDSVWNKTVRCDQPPSRAELSAPSEENVVTGARDPSDAILPCPGGAGTQTRVDAWIHNQIKTVRSDRSGRQSSWSCWINEAPACFRMPGFWMTRLITAHLPEPFSTVWTSGPPNAPPVVSFPSATAEGAISLQAGPRRDLELMQGKAAPSRTFWVFGLCLRSRHPWLSWWVRAAGVPVRGCQAALSKTPLLRPPEPPRPSVVRRVRQHRTNHHFTPIQEIQLYLLAHTSTSFLNTCGDDAVQPCQRNAAVSFPPTK